MQEKSRPKVFVYFFLILAMVFWGLSFVWYKQALVYFRPISLIFLRLIISFPLLFLLAFLTNKLKLIKLRDIPIFLLLAFFEPFLYFLGEVFGMNYISSTGASIIVATIPLFISIIAYFVFSEKLSVLSYIGIFLSFIGVVLVVLSDKESSFSTWRGILLMTLAVVSAVGYGLILKKIAGKYPPLTIVSMQNFIGAIYYLPFFLIFEWPLLSKISLSFEMVVPLLNLSIFASAIAYLGYVNGLKNLGVSKSSVFTNFIPVVTAIAAHVILDEQMYTIKIIGIALVVIGLIFSQTRKRKVVTKPEELIVDELY